MRLKQNVLATAEPGLGKRRSIGAQVMEYVFSRMQALGRLLVTLVTYRQVTGQPKPMGSQVFCARLSTRLSDLTRTTSNSARYGKDASPTGAGKIWYGACSYAGTSPQSIYEAYVLSIRVDYLLLRTRVKAQVTVG